MHYFPRTRSIPWRHLHMSLCSASSPCQARTVGCLAFELPIYTPLRQRPSLKRSPLTPRKGFALSNRCSLLLLMTSLYCHFSRCPVGRINRPRRRHLARPPLGSMTTRLPANPYLSLCCPSSPPWTVQRLPANGIINPITVHEFHSTMPR